jgi:hypothetical protein
MHERALPVREISADRRQRVERGRHGVVVEDVEVAAGEGQVAGKRTAVPAHVGVPARADCTAADEPANPLAKRLQAAQVGEGAGNHLACDVAAQTRVGLGERDDGLGIGRKEEAVRAGRRHLLEERGVVLCPRRDPDALRDRPAERAELRHQSGCLRPVEDIVLEIDDEDRAAPAERSECVGPEAGGPGGAVAVKAEEVRGRAEQLCGGCAVDEGDVWTSSCELLKREPLFPPSGPIRMRTPIPSTSNAAPISASPIAAAASGQRLRLGSAIPSPLRVASASSRPVWKRSSGSFARAVRIASSSPGAAGGSSSRCANSTAVSEARANGGSPVTHSKSRQPSE